MKCGYHPIFSKSGLDSRALTPRLWLPKELSNCSFEICTLSFKKKKSHFKVILAEKNVKIAVQKSSMRKAKIAHDPSS